MKPVVFIFMLVFSFMMISCKDQLNTHSSAYGAPAKREVQTRELYDGFFRNKGAISLFDIADFDIEQLGFLRNEIFAIHGYQFKTEKYREYFSKQKWYKADPTFRMDELSDTEKANAALIQNWEYYLKGQTDDAGVLFNVGTISFKNSKAYANVRGESLLGLNWYYRAGMYYRETEKELKGTYHILDKVVYFVSQDKDFFAYFKVPETDQEKNSGVSLHLVYDTISE